MTARCFLQKKAAIRYRSQEYEEVIPEAAVKPLSSFVTNLCLSLVVTGFTH
jgi:hypothetical protein